MCFIVIEVNDMNAIMWDEESIFPEKIENFKKLLKKYLKLNNCTTLLENNLFITIPNAISF